MRRSPPPLLACISLLVAACGSGDGGDAAPTTQGSERAPEAVCSERFEGELLVAAAASLTEAFTDVGEGFEEECGGTITFTFDSSGTLAQQIIDGAPVDVFASADTANLERVADEGLTADDAQVFARNQLVIVTQPGNPEGIDSLADLIDVGVVSLCAEDAPCGRFAAEVLDAAGVVLDERSVTRGQNAKAATAAVTQGDAVAGIVYVTDARTAGDAAEAVEIADATDVIATYPLAVLRGAADPDLADAFVAYVRSARGTAALAERGFLPPT